MAAEQDITATYEELMHLEQDFDEVETEIIRKQVELSRPLYEKRQALIAKIPNFWALVFEQAPPEIDEFIHPSDAAVIVQALKSVSVSHFDIDNGTAGPDGPGDPRNIAIRFEFSENDFFENTVLEKKFWYRRSRSGWAGLVSEPVDIKWKEGKDLTDGLVDLANRVYAEQKAGSNRGEQPSATERQLHEKLEQTGIGNISFFAWFAYRGPTVTAEENEKELLKEREHRRLRQEGKPVPEDEDDDDEEDDGFEIDIFPAGEDIAVTIAEDLWPNAIRYFTQAQEEHEAMSDEEEDSDEDEDMETA